MAKRCLLFLVVALVLLLASPVFASSPNFTAHLSGDNEVPARETLAQGQAWFQLDKEGTELSYRLIAANIENILQAHIHLAPAFVNDYSSLDYRAQLAVN